MFRHCLFLSLFFLSSCTSYLFLPVKPFPIIPDSLNLFYDDLYLQTDDGLTLHGWKIYTETNSKGSILFFHGNGDNVSTQLPHTYWLAREGYDLYVFDYRGYGQSQGEVDLDKTVGDLELMIAGTLGLVPEKEKITVLGHSLGGALAIYGVAHSAFRDRIKALVTVEAFSDYHDVTQDVLAKSWLFWLFQWPLSFTVSNDYSPLEAAPGVSPVPWLILHSERDEIIDIYHARRLYEAAREPKSLRLIDSGHNDIFNKKKNRQVLLDYLKKL